MTQPPVKQFDDGSKRRDDGERRGFFYFDPAKRRPSLYEEVTIDTQLSTGRHIDHGWLISFDDGRGSHSLGSTKLRVADWFAWRDPAGLWERPFYQQAAHASKEQDAAVSGARSEGLFGRMTEEWREFLRTRLQVPAFYEQGIWRASAPASRPALSDAIAHAIVLQAAMKQRQAQDLVVYAMDLEAEIGDCDIDAAKEVFLSDPAWQPIRSLVEQLDNRTDWMERVVAANLCIEPVVGNLLRREMLLIPASANGDPVTPVIIGSAQRDWLWTKDWTAELVKFTLDDPEHGVANRAVLEEWAGYWNPLAEEAARAVLPEIAKVPKAGDPEQILAQVLAERDALHAEAGLKASVPA